MSKEFLPSDEVSLDPDDWGSLRNIAHEMVDDMVDYLSAAREKSAWKPMPEEVKESLEEEVPLEGSDLTEIYDLFKKSILPYPTGNVHPRFWGWVMTNGTATGMLADMLASGMNAHLAGFNQSAAVVEKRVIEWLKEMFEFPASAGGLLVSGGTMANINGVTVARNMKSGFDLKSKGLQHKDAPELTIYGSKETHSWIYKCCDFLGLGTDSFRAIDVNEEYQIDVDACEVAIVRDLANGKKPFCIVGTVGTVGTGAIDDISALRELADKYDLWLHVDGAFGSLIALSPESKKLAEGQQHADSIGFDLHKWAYMPYEAASVLVRNRKDQNDVFTHSPSYLKSADKGVSIDTTFFADKGLQLSRGFRALKVWMSLKEQGVNKIGRIIEQNIDQAKYLESLVRRSDELELLAPVSLNIVCLRYIAEGLTGEELDQLNQRILIELQESGLAVPSQTLLQGRFAIRVCITNHRTTLDDMKVFADGVVAIGRRFLKEK